MGAEAKWRVGASEKWAQRLISSHPSTLQRCLSAWAESETGCESVQVGASTLRPVPCADLVSPGIQNFAIWGRCLTLPPFPYREKKKKKCLNTALHTLDGITPLGGRLLQPNLWGRRSEKCWFETYYVNFFLSLLQTASLREMSQQSPLFLSSCKSLVCSN